MAYENRWPGGYLYSTQSELRSEILSYPTFCLSELHRNYTSWQHCWRKPANSTENGDKAQATQSRLNRAV